MGRRWFLGALVVLTLAGCASLAPDLPELGVELDYRSQVAPSEPFVVAVTLNQGVPGSRFDLVRYWNNKFQDYQSVKIHKRGRSTEWVRWAPGPFGAGHRPGTYRLKVFFNGRFVQEISYTVG